MNSLRVATGMMGLLALGMAGSARAAGGSVEIEGSSGFTVAVAMPMPDAATDPLHLNPGDISVALAYGTPDNLAAGASAQLDNVGVYFTIEAHRKRNAKEKGFNLEPNTGNLTIPPDITPSVVLATFGCGMGTFTPGVSATYSGLSCNNAPLVLSGTTYPLWLSPDFADPSQYEIVSRVNVVYSAANGASGVSGRTASSYVAVQNSLHNGLENTKLKGQASLSCTAADACPTVELRSKRFDAMAEFAGTLPTPGSSVGIDVGKLALWVRSERSADDVVLIVNFSYGTDQARQAVGTISCAVGSLEDGQTVVYQGQSCNLPSGGLLIPKGAAGNLYAQYSVVYTGNATCVSKPVAVVALGAASPEPSGMSFERDRQGHQHTDCLNSAP